MHPGDRLAFGPHVVDRDEVIAFATRYDPQPFHLSEEAAANTYFGRLAASGWHTCAMTMRMMLDAIAADTAGAETASLGSPGVDELRFLHPVYPGDTLKGESEVIDARASQSRPEMGLVRSRITVRNQDEQPVLSFVATLFLRRRPAGAGPL